MWCDRSPSRRCRLRASDVRLGKSSFRRVQGEAMHRREFLKNGAVALTVAATKPLFAWQGANNRVRMAVIGMGGRSGRVFDSLTRYDDVQFTMGCEVNQPRADAFKNGRPL